MARDGRRDSSGVCPELSGERTAAAGMGDDRFLRRDARAGADSGRGRAAAFVRLDDENRAVRDGLYALSLPMQHDRSHHPKGNRQYPLGTARNAASGGNRCAVLQASESSALRAQNP